MYGSPSPRPSPARRRGRSRRRRRARWMTASARAAAARRTSRSVRVPRTVVAPSTSRSLRTSASTEWPASIEGRDHGRAEVSGASGDEHVHAGHGGAQRPRSPRPIWFAIDTIRGITDLDLVKVRGFVAVAEELHFRRAAEALHIAQPALSRQIQALEQQLGTKLLERDRRNVSLTPAGRQLLDDAVPLLAAADATRRRVQRAARGTSALVVGFRTGIIPTAAVRAVPRRAPRRHRRGPAARMGRPGAGGARRARGHRLRAPPARRARPEAHAALRRAPARRAAHRPPARRPRRAHDGRPRATSTTCATSSRSRPARPARRSCAASRRSSSTSPPATGSSSCRSRRPGTTPARTSSTCPSPTPSPTRSCSPTRPPAARS